MFALIAGVAALAVFGAACDSSSGLSYVSSSDRNAYFKVPSDWHFFDKRFIMVASGESLSAESDRQLPWLIAFDADPKPSISHVINIADATKFPVILARVQVLPFQVRDQLSLNTIRNMVYPIDRLVQANAGEVLTYKDVVLPGGLHGSRMTYDVAPQGLSNPTSGSSVIRVTQVGVVDSATRKLYMFVIRCESHCYRDNKTLIDQIVDSWTVKER